MARVPLPVRATVTARATAIAQLAAEVGLRAASIAVRGVPDNGGGAFSADFDSARQLYPASMIKTPIAMVLARHISRGLRRRDDPIVITPEHMTANDAPSPLVVGYRTTLGDVADRMLARSDNVATNALIDLVGRETLTAGCRELGLERTAVRCKLSGAEPLLEDPAITGRNSHPACDAAAAFVLIALHRRDAFGWVYDALRAQIWNGKLSRGWGITDTFAHKTGDTSATSHDGGILTLPDGRQFVIVVYTASASTPQTDAAFATFARGLRPLLSSL